MKIDNTGRVISFSEKPKGDDLKAMGVDTSVSGLSREEAVKKPYIASMGIYVFRKDVLLNLQRRWFPSANYFGTENIPTSAKEFHVKQPRFSFYDEDTPMYTSRPNLITTVDDKRQQEPEAVEKGEETGRKKNE